MIHNGRRYRVTYSSTFTHVTPTLWGDGQYNMTWVCRDGEIFRGACWKASSIEFSIRNGGFVEDEALRVEELLKDYEK
jgi:hypothetical protein